MKKIIIMSLAFLMAFVSVFTMDAATGHAADFRDVNSAEVTRLANDGIVSGFPGNEFRPRVNVTRAQAAVMIGRSLGLSEANKSNSFRDVSSNHYAAGFITSAASKGILSGYTDGTFRPDQNLTRGEMAAILTRSFNYQRERGITFSDVRPGSMFYSEIMELAASGITSGYPDGTYGTNRSINRHEFSLMLARTLYPEYRPDVAGTSLENVIGNGTVVRTNSLNVRPDGSTNYSPIGTVSGGTVVNIHEIDGNWALVSASGIRGYVSLSYLTLSNMRGSLAGRTIVVDAGHGGSDPGAIANGIREKDVALDVSLRLESKLREAGANVIMTRRGDTFPSLQDRVRIANNSGADIFISVHFNAAGSTAARGTETFYNTTYWAGNSKGLADALQKHMLRRLGTVDRGVKTANFYVIRHTTMPSALVELGFLTNYAEAQRIKTASFREAGAQALYDGVVEYFSTR